MYCSECGAKADDNAIFCEVCGAKILTPEENKVEVSEEVAATTNTSKSIDVKDLGLFHIPLGDRKWFKEHGAHHHHHHHRHHHSSSSSSSPSSDSSKSKSSSSSESSSDK